MALTNVAIKSAKPGAKPFKLADSEGLHLLVQPNGARYWRMNYRFLGKHKTLAFGVWPDISLADARAKRDAARRLIANGIDPAEKAKQDKIAANVAAANTFEAVANELLAKTEREGFPPCHAQERTAGCSALSRPLLAAARLRKSPRMNCYQSSALSRHAVATKPPSGCARFAARSSAMPSPPPAQTAMLPLTSKAR
jgi:hypothetical protein